MKIEQWKIEDIIPYENNPRINDAAVEKTAISIREYGWQQPIVVDSDGVLIVGHTRLKAAKSLGIDSVPVLVAGDLSEAQVKAYRIADNKTGEIATWDEELLGIEIQGLVDLDFDIELTGFELDDFDFLQEEQGGLTDDDEVPEVEESICKLGDLWTLGEHKILCGDSTDIKQVERLMDGQKADMVFTDPPYGMDAVKNSGVLKSRYKEIIGDNTTETAIKSFKLSISLKPKRIVYWGANYYPECLPSSGCWLVWDKNNGGSDQADAELAWTNFKGVVRKYTRASEKKDRVHPTQKPVDMISWVFDKWGLKNTIVHDPFLGSGSTLIACEKTNRKCYGMELDEIYCTVILNRWADYTGKDPVREDGVKFSELKNG